MTDAERKQRERDRRKAGLVRVEAWVPADRVEAVRKAIARAARMEQAENVGTQENHVGTHEK